MNDIAWRFAPSLIDEALRRALPASELPEETLKPEPDARGHAPDSQSAPCADSCPSRGAQTATDERAALHQAMNYAVFGGGKRLRSQLALEAAGIVGGDTALEKALPAACAIELIHAYSLVHDDLPAMDNADTRRGRPSCHRQFGEAVAILAGDALLTMAFEVLAGDVILAGDAEPDESPLVNARVDAASLLRVIRLVAQAAGEAGMVGGQAIDIAWSNVSANAQQGARLGDTSVSGESLTRMHAMKTGALIRVAAEAGAVLGGGTMQQIRALRDYGAHLGRAFQLTDDLLDATGDPHRTGKAATDSANGKATAPQVFGLAQTVQLAREASEAAVAALEDFGAQADTLRQLARFVAQREK